MEFIKKLDLTPMKALKMAGIVLAAVILLAFGLSLIGASFRSFSNGDLRTFAFKRVGDNMAFSVAPSADVYQESGMVSVSRGAVGGTMTLSARNVMPMPPIMGGGTTGDTAEAFEVTNYSASIETGNVDDVCSQVLDLKTKTYIIFENSNAYDHGCNYTFKVKKANVTEVLAFINKLDPKDLSENTQTIKGQVDDFTSETEILKKKLASIDETLKSALAAYNEITALATRSENADALAKIIDSKVGIIERMTQERINVNTQLDYIARAKADQLDRLEYTYFNVNVYENKFIDGDNLGDSWKQAVRQFFYDVNRIIQEVTLGLITLLLVGLQFVLYIFIAVFVAKYVWRGVRAVWRR